MKLSVVIPCYNEKENIPLVLNRFEEVMDKENIEVIIVDNGSTDGTEDIIQGLITKYSFARMIRIEKNQGYGYGIKKGLEVTSGDYIGWTHADMQTDPIDVIKAYNIIIKHGDRPIYVKGTRKGRPLIDRLFTVGMSVFETLYFHVKLYDINAQPNFFPRFFYEEWKGAPDDFELEVFALYKAKKDDIHIVRYPVEFPARIYGKSSWNSGFKSKIQMIGRTIKYSKEMKGSKRKTMKDE